MVELAICQNVRKEAVLMTGLTGFYLFGAIMLLIVALVYFADAIRERKGKRK